MRDRRNSPRQIDYKGVIYSDPRLYLEANKPEPHLEADDSRLLSKISEMHDHQGDSIITPVQTLLWCRY